LCWVYFVVSSDISLPIKELIVLIYTTKAGVHKVNCRSTVERIKEWNDILDNAGVSYVTNTDILKKRKGLKDRISASAAQQKQIRAARKELKMASENASPFPGIRLANADPNSSTSVPFPGVRLGPPPMPSDSPFPGIRLAPPVSEPTSQGKASPFPGVRHTPSDSPFPGIRFNADASLALNTSTISSRIDHRASTCTKSPRNLNNQTDPTISGDVNPPEVTETWEISSPPKTVSKDKMSRESEMTKV
jgi:hypothetical protein